MKKILLIFSGLIFFSVIIFLFLSWLKPVLIVPSGVRIVWLTAKATIFQPPTSYNIGFQADQLEKKFCKASGDLQIKELFYNGESLRIELLGYYAKPAVAACIEESGVPTVGATIDASWMLKGSAEKNLVVILNGKENDFKFLISDGGYVKIVPIEIINVIIYDSFIESKVFY